jgi:hypothetical protein
MHVKQYPFCVVCIGTEFCLIKSCTSTAQHTILKALFASLQGSYISPLICPRSKNCNKIFKTTFFRNPKFTLICNTYSHNIFEHLTNSDRTYNFVQQESAKGHNKSNSMCFPVYQFFTTCDIFIYLKIIPS